MTGSDLEIEANGVSICYDDFGSGSVPIIFIHGFPFDKSSWRLQLDFLKKTNRVIAYDIRGFGNSGSDETEFSMDLFADDLIKFMDSLQIKEAIVCGLSMGGYVLLNAVNRFPGRFKALVLSDTQCISDSIEVKEKRDKTIQQIIDGGLPDFTQNFVSSVFSKATFISKQLLVEEIKQVILSTSPKTITKTLHALAQRRDMCFSLQAISIPSLILCGMEDTVTPLIQSEILVEHIPHSNLHSIDNAGHLSNLEQPDEFNKHLISFISKVESSTLFS